MRIATQAIDRNPIQLLEAQFSGTGGISAYLRGDALSFRAGLPIKTRRKTMNRFRIFSAAAILSLMLATPVFAQAAIQEPGLFAFYYPNNDVLNGGRPTPAAGLDARTPVLLGSGGPSIPMDSSGNGASCAQRYHSYDPASRTFVGYDGRRHESQ
jgi:BA14K-like protein